MRFSPSGAARPQSGIALIIVMICVTVLAILAGGFAYSMKVETRLARNSNSEEELEWLGRSGIEYARWILAEEMKIPSENYDAENQVWAGGPGGIGTTNTPLVDVQRTVKLGNGSFTWKIVDHERKMNINTAGQPILQQAMILAGVDAGETTPLVSSILDWIDPNVNAHHIQGAKSDYYRNLPHPYDAKNGPIDDLSELLLIKGISPDLYWGPLSTNHPPGYFRQDTTPFHSMNQGDLPPQFPVGLVDLFTPLSTGQINVNTASASVLQLIPGLDQVMAEAIVAGRSGEDDGSGLTGPYRNIGDLQRVPELPRVGPVRASLNQYCSTRSRTFEVTVEARVGNYTRSFIGILGRNSPRDIQLLEFYWK